jgi:hypothetical protein
MISNASDACDKLRFEALHNGALFEDDSEFKIRVSFNKDARTLTIADNGVGMSRDEVISNLGTIAKSGTREFFSQLSGKKIEERQLDRAVRRWSRCGWSATAPVHCAAIGRSGGDITLCKHAASSIAMPAPCAM